MKKIFSNHEIRGKEVYVVKDKMEGPVLKKEAMKEAQEQELDLVQIAIKDDIPICKYLDYNKYMYGLKKKEKGNKHKKQELKEIKITANTEEHDIKIKENKIRKMLEKGCEIKITMMFRGREKANKKFYVPKLESMVEDLMDVAVVSKKIKITDYNAFVILKSNR